MFNKTNLKNWSVHIKEKRPEDGKSSIIRSVVISSGEVIADPQVVKKHQKSYRKMIGFEMEGSSVAATIKNEEKQTEFLMIRAISDFEDKNKENDKVWRSYALDAATSYTYAFLKSGPVHPS